MSDPKPGDLVRLKSGGPTMTFERYAVASSYMGEYNLKDQARCGWFNNGTYCGQVFPIAALEVVAP